MADILRNADSATTIRALRLQNSEHSLEQQTLDLLETWDRRIVLEEARILLEENDDVKADLTNRLGIFKQRVAIKTAELLNQQPNMELPGAAGIKPEAIASEQLPGSADVLAGALGTTASATGGRGPSRNGRKL